MKKVIHTCKFVGIDEERRDDTVSLSYLKSGGVLLCVHKGEAVVFHATITKESWESMLETFKT